MSMPDFVWIWPNDPGGELVVSTENEPRPTSAPVYFRQGTAPDDVERLHAGNQWLRIALITIGNTQCEPGEEADALKGIKGIAEMALHTAEQEVTNGKEN